MCRFSGRPVGTFGLAAVHPIAPGPFLRKMLRCPKNELGPGRGVNDLVGQLGAREIIKPLPAAMTWDQIVRTNLLTRQ